FFFDETVQGFKNIWAWLLKINQGIVDFLLGPIESLTNAIKKLPSIGGKIGKFFGIGEDGAGQLQPALPIGLPSPLNPILSGVNRTVSKSTQLKIENLTVDARGGDSKEIAQNVGSALGDQLKNTVEDFDSKIDR
ncbi:hypothetical protein KA005_45175, partial [bacterium]|nr:hypothetical protein [bacterium]